jgi:hypothetical protein
MNNDPKRLYKEVWIGLEERIRQYTTEVRFEEYLAYTEETERLSHATASQLDGNVEQAIKKDCP